MDSNGTYSVVPSRFQFPNCYDGIDVLAQCYAGACVNGSCVCDPGWSGWTDYTPMDLSEWGGPVLSCGVFNPVVKALWCIPIIPLVMYLLTWVPAVREQYRVFTKKRNKGKWYHHMPLNIAVFFVLFEVSTLLALIGVKLALDGDNLIGVHAAPTIICAIANFNANFWLVVNDLALTKSALRSPLAKGDQTPREIEARIRKLTKNRVLTGLPIMFLDVPSLVSMCFAPIPGPGMLFLKHAVLVVRVVHLIVCILITYCKYIPCMHHDKIPMIPLPHILSGAVPSQVYGRVSITCVATLSHSHQNMPGPKGGLQCLVPHCSTRLVFLPPLLTLFPAASCSGNAWRSNKILALMFTQVREWRMHVMVYNLKCIVYAPSFSSTVRSSLPPLNISLSRSLSLPPLHPSVHPPPRRS